MTLKKSWDILVMMMKLESSRMGWKWTMKSRIKNKLLFCISTIIIFLSGCVQNGSSEQITESSAIESHRVQDTKTLEDTETLNTVVGADILETKETEKNGSLETEEFESEEAISHDYASVFERADYASIYEKAINYAIPVLCEEGYEILCENICVNPKSVYEDSWLVEQLEDILDSCRDWESAATDYFLFDLNDDGIDEYIVSIDAPGWVGTSGNLVEILRKNEDGSPDTIFYVIAELYFDKNEYLPLTVLNDKSDGYYKIVFPFTGMIWEYNGEEDRYFTCYPYRPDE